MQYINIANAKEKSQQNQ